MNHYTHALVKEIAAQRLGFEPSPMWGRMVAKGDLQDHKREYKHVMNSVKPEHMLPSKALEHVMGEAKRVIKAIPKGSHIKADGFNLK